jgi:hypothetical protein
MKLAIVGSLTALLAGAGLALAQQPDETLPRPRSSSAATSDVSADQPGSAPAFTYGFGGDPGTVYGPPPSFRDPVCGSQGPPYKWWLEGDYDLWWLKRNNFPALLVSAPAAGAGAPGTVLLAGGNDLDRSLRNGGGLTLGGWFTDYQGFGIEGSFFVMETSNKSFAFGGPGATGTNSIVRPFFDVLAGGPGFAPVVVPGFVSGSAAGAAEGLDCDSGRFNSAGFDFIGNLCCDRDCRLDLLVGYRYFGLADRFGMSTTSVATTTVLLPNGALANSVTDRISTSDNFNGGEIGLRGEWHGDCWLIRATARVAFGATDEGADLSGSTFSLSPLGVPTVSNGGFLVRPSNAGSFSATDFAVVPQAELKVALRVCDWLRLTAGYTVLYWSNVARAGDQVNVAINRLEVPSLAPPTGFIAAQPATLIKCSDFWAHGATVGIEVRW